MVTAGCLRRFRLIAFTSSLAISAGCNIGGQALDALFAHATIEETAAAFSRQTVIDETIAQPLSGQDIVMVFEPVDLAGDSFAYNDLEEGQNLGDVLTETPVLNSDASTIGDLAELVSEALFATEAQDDAACEPEQVQGFLECAEAICEPGDVTCLGDQDTALQCMEQLSSNGCFTCLLPALSAEDTSDLTSAIFGCTDPATTTLALLDYVFAGEGAQAVGDELQQLIEGEFVSAIQALREKMVMRIDKGIISGTWPCHDWGYKADIELASLTQVALNDVNVAVSYPEGQSKLTKSNRIVFHIDAAALTADPVVRAWTWARPTTCEGVDHATVDRAFPIEATGISFDVVLEVTRPDKTCEKTVCPSGTDACEANCCDPRSQLHILIENVVVDDVQTDLGTVSSLFPGNETNVKIAIRLANTFTSADVSNNISHYVGDLGELLVSAADNKTIGRVPLGVGGSTIRDLHVDDGEIEWHIKGEVDLDTNAIPDQCQYVDNFAPGFVGLQTIDPATIDDDNPELIPAVGQLVIAPTFSDKTGRSVLPLGVTTIVGGTPSFRSQSIVSLQTPNAENMTSPAFAHDATIAHSWSKPGFYGDEAWVNMSGTQFGPDAVALPNGCMTIRAESQGVTYALWDNDISGYLIFEDACSVIVTEPQVREDSVPPMVKIDNIQLQPLSDPTHVVVNTTNWDVNNQASALRFRLYDPTATQVWFDEDDLGEPIYESTLVSVPAVDDETMLAGTLRRQTSHTIPLPAPDSVVDNLVVFVEACEGPFALGGVCENSAYHIFAIGELPDVPSTTDYEDLVNQIINGGDEDCYEELLSGFDPTVVTKYFGGAGPNLGSLYMPDPTQLTNGCGGIREPSRPQHGQAEYVCTPTTTEGCGNCVVDEGEICDQGADNGKIGGWCRSTCDGYTTDAREYY